MTWCSCWHWCNACRDNRSAKSQKDVFANRSKYPFHSTRSWISLGAADTVCQQSNNMQAGFEYVTIMNAATLFVPPAVALLWWSHQQRPVAYQCIIHSNSFLFAAADPLHFFVKKKLHRGLWMHLKDETLSSKLLVPLRRTLSGEIKYSWIWTMWILGVMCLFLCIHSSLTSCLLLG